MKIFELGYAKISTDHPENILKIIIDTADKWSALGWEFKCIYESSMGETVMFFQREKSVTSTPPSTSQPVA